MSGFGRQFLREGADSVAALDTRATANTVRFRRLARHKRILVLKGFRRVSTYLACARFEIRYGRIGEGRDAARMPVGTAGEKRGNHCVCAGCGYSGVIP